MQTSFKIELTSRQRAILTYAIRSAARNQEREAERSISPSLKDGSSKRASELREVLAFVEAA